MFSALLIASASPLCADLQHVQVEAKLAVPRDADGPGSRGYVEPALRVTKIFVGGLPPSCEDADLREYFSQFGTVTEHQVRAVIVVVLVCLIILTFAALRFVCGRLWWTRALKRAGETYLLACLNAFVTDFVQRIWICLL